MQRIITVIIKCKEKDQEETMNNGEKDKWSKKEY